MHPRRAGQRDVARDGVSTRNPGTDRAGRATGPDRAVRPDRTTFAALIRHPGAHRAGYRLAVAAVLVTTGIAQGGRAPAAVAPPTYFVFTYPGETTLAQFTQMDVFFSSSQGGTPFPISVLLRGVTVATAMTNANHAYTSPDLAVPAGAAACGQNPVTIVYTGGRTPVTLAAADITVYCPTVTVTPNPVNSGGGLAVFTVSGTGYPPDRTVDLTIDGQTPGFGSAFTDGNGAFSQPAQRPALACGTHRITATGEPPPAIGTVLRSVVDPSPSLPASTDFTVGGCAVASAPKITANPAVLTDGTLTHLTGTGFAPNQAVSLTWQTVAGAQLAACSPNADSAPALTADAAGKVDTYCYARPHELLGATQIVATQGAQHAAAPVVVEGGSMQPSSGDQFIFRR